MKTTRIPYGPSSRKNIIYLLCTLGVFSITIWIYITTRDTEPAVIIAPLFVLLFVALFGFMVSISYSPRAMPRMEITSEVIRIPVYNKKPRGRLREIPVTSLVNIIPKVEERNFTKHEAGFDLKLTDGTKLSFIVDYFENRESYEAAKILLMQVCAIGKATESLASQMVAQTTVPDSGQEAEGLPRIAKETSAAPVEYVYGSRSIAILILTAIMWANTAIFIFAGFKDYENGWSDGFPIASVVVSAISFVTGLVFAVLAMRGPRRADYLTLQIYEDRVCIPLYRRRPYRRETIYFDTIGRVTFQSGSGTAEGIKITTRTGAERVLLKGWFPNKEDWKAVRDRFENI